MPAFATAGALVDPGLGNTAAIGAQNHALEQKALAWKPFNTNDYLAALGARRPMVVTFGAQWCAPCRELKTRTFNDHEVIRAASGFELLYVDITNEDGYTRDVKNRFQVRGVPMTIFFGADGDEYTRRLGFIPPALFARLLRESAEKKQPTPDDGLNPTPPV